MAIFTSPSVSLTDVVNTIGLASNGDTVVVPAGTATWTSTLIIGKAITLQGAGVGQTIIKDGVSVNDLIKWTLVANQPSRLTSIEFQDGGRTSGQATFDFFGSNVNGSSLRVDNCHFNQQLGALFCHTIIGVIDHNTFDIPSNGLAAVIRVFGTQWDVPTQISGDKSWSDPPGYGSSQFLFIEDNTFNSTSKSATDSFEGARFVMRHNTFNNAALIQTHGTESHGRGRGTRVVEAYNNTWVGNNSDYFIGGLRSGSMLLHHNNISGHQGDAAVFGAANFRIDYPFMPFGGADGTNVWDVNDTSDHTGNGYGGGPNGVFATGTAASASSGTTVTVTGANWTTNQWVNYIIRRTSNMGNVTTTTSEGIISNTANTISFTNRADLAEPLRHVTFAAGDTLEIRKLVKVLDGIGVGNGDLMQDVTKSVSLSNGVADITCNNHGLNVQDTIYFSGAPSGSNITGGFYYIISTTTNTFRITSTLGSAIAFIPNVTWSGTIKAMVNTVTGKASPLNQVDEPCYAWNNVNELGHQVGFAPNSPGYFCLLGVHYFNNTPPPFSYTPYTYPHPLTLGLSGSITNPLSGNFVSGTITVSATASTSPSLSIAGVQFKLDGSNLGAEVLSAPYSVQWITTSAINGSHTLSAVVRDSGGNTFTTPAISVSVNNNVAPPMISGVNTSNATDVAATVNWTTDTASDSQVFYGTTTAYGSSTTLNTSLVTSHSQTLTGLSSTTTYHFQVKSKDAAGNLATSGDFMFTSTTGADITPPSVSITAPSAGTVSGITTVTATASDNVGVVGVQFRLDALNLGTEVLASPYTISWDTKTATNASHTLTAIARDAAGNKTTSSGVTVTASNAPIISGVGVSGITDTVADIEWTTNQTSDSQVDYGLTSGYGSSSTLNTNFVTFHSVSLSGLSPSTTYHFRVKSRNAQSLLTTSGDFQFTTAADISPPTLSITAPTAASTVSGSAVTVSANASDDVGVISVQFLVDGVNIGLDSVTPFSITWNTTTLTNGTHVLTAIAKDGANNQTTSAPISVTVSNSPIISAVNSSSISSTGAAIQWTTNHACDSKINYGLTSGYGSSTTLDSTLVMSHLQTLTGLTPSTNYHFAVLSRDAQGNLTTSGDFIFQTTASGGDATPPTVSMTAPPNGTTVSGKVVVAANASDNVGVAGVQFKVDGNNLGSQVTVAPYSILWNTNQYSNASHVVGAVATDTSGNTASASTVTVTVSNAPGGQGHRKRLLI